MSLSEDDFNREMARCQKELAKPLLEIYEYAKEIQKYYPEGIDIKPCRRCMMIILQRNDTAGNLIEINPAHRDKPGPNVAFYEQEKDSRKDSKGLQTLKDIGMISESDCDLLSKLFPDVKKQ